MQIMTMAIMMRYKETGTRNPLRRGKRRMNWYRGNMSKVATLYGANKGREPDV